MALIASSNQSKESVDLGLIEKVTKVTTMEVVSDMTTTALGVIIGLFCFLVTVLVLLFQLLASQNNEKFDQNKERFEQAERENERRHQENERRLDLRFKLIEQRLFPDQPTHHHAPNINQAILPPTIFPPHNPLISATTTTTRPPPSVPTRVHSTPILSHFTSKWCACSCCRRQSRESVQQQQPEPFALVPGPSAALSAHGQFPLTTNPLISSLHEQTTSTNLPPAPTSSQCSVDTKSKQVAYTPSAVTESIDDIVTTH
uniref:Uncharacterized protein n=1 Tax=Meloidogyne enterolobii TaxID=390850 RepID=A0A6V7VR14_MELEN|nr:unnamed protein product [Meloidogyne enterolobii]